MSRNNPRDHAKAKLRRRLREERRLAAKGGKAKPASKTTGSQVAAPAQS